MYISPLVLPLGLGPPRSGNGAWVLTIKLICRKCDEYESPAAAPSGGGQIKRGRPGRGQPFAALVLFFARFLAGSLASQRGLYTFFLAGLQVEGVALNLLDNVFLLHLALEAA